MGDAPSPAIGLMTALPQIPNTCNSVYPEEHSNSACDGRMRGLRRAGTLVTVELIAQVVFGREEGPCGVAGVLVNREPLVVPLAVLDGASPLRGNAVGV